MGRMQFGAHFMQKPRQETKWNAEGLLCRRLRGVVV
jgi:hypothetical protein